ncbi:hypothetical protein GCM10007881_33890 [Mesorhizobium huakuii]|nr:hypothetical protein GCM10007881_33890 [Mesorhizobium huakuii]
MLGHLVQAEDETQPITIHRIDSGGTPTLYTSVSFEEARVREIRQAAWREPDPGFSKNAPSVLVVTATNPPPATA